MIGGGIMKLVSYGASDVYLIGLSCNINKEIENDNYVYKNNYLLKKIDEIREKLLKNGENEKIIKIDKLKNNLKNKKNKNM